MSMFYLIEYIYRMVDVNEKVPFVVMRDPVKQFIHYFFVRVNQKALPKPSTLPRTW